MCLSKSNEIVDVLPILKSVFARECPNAHVFVKLLEWEKIDLNSHKSCEHKLNKSKVKIQPQINLTAATKFYEHVT